MESRVIPSGRKIYRLKVICFANNEWRMNSSDSAEKDSRQLSSCSFKNPMSQGTCFLVRYFQKRTLTCLTFLTFSCLTPVMLL